MQNKPMQNWVQGLAKYGHTGCGGQVCCQHYHRIPLSVPIPFSLNEYSFFFMSIFDYPFMTFSLVHYLSRVLQHFPLFVSVLSSLFVYVISLHLFLRL